MYCFITWASRGLARPQPWLKEAQMKRTWLPTNSKWRERRFDPPPLTRSPALKFSCQFVEVRERPPSTCKVTNWNVREEKRRAVIGRSAWSTLKWPRLTSFQKENVSSLSAITPHYVFFSFEIPHEEKGLSIFQLLCVSLFLTLSNPKHEIKKTFGDSRRRPVKSSTLYFGLPSECKRIRGLTAVLAYHVLLHVPLPVWQTCGSNRCQKVNLSNSHFLPSFLHMQTSLGQTPDTLLSFFYLMVFCALLPPTERRSQLVLFTVDQFCSSDRYRYLKDKLIRHASLET